MKRPFKKLNRKIILKPLLEIGQSDLFASSSGKIYRRHGYNLELFQEVSSVKNQYGYHYIVFNYNYLSHRTWLVHRLILSAFLGKCPKGKIGCHKDDNKDNNSIRNLYWGTYKQNGLDAARNRKRRNKQKTKSTAGPAC